MIKSMKNLDKLRVEINQIDQELLKLLKRRLEAVSQIGQIKKLQGIEVKDSKREEQVMDRLSELGSSLGINREIIEKIWKTLFEISYKIEE